MSSIAIVMLYELLSIKNAIFLICTYFCFFIATMRSWIVDAWTNWSARNCQTSTWISTNLYDLLLNDNLLIIFANLYVQMRFAWLIIRKKQNEFVQRTFSSRFKRRSWWDRTIIHCIDDVQTSEPESSALLIEMYKRTIIELFHTILIWRESTTHTLILRCALLWRLSSIFINIYTKAKIESRCSFRTKRTRLHDIWMIVISVHVKLHEIFSSFAIITRIRSLLVWSCIFQNNSLYTFLSISISTSFKHCWKKRKQRLHAFSITMQNTLTVVICCIKSFRNIMFITASATSVVELHDNENEQSIVCIIAISHKTRSITFVCYSLLCENHKASNNFVLWMIMFDQLFASSVLHDVC